MKKLIKSKLFLQVIVASMVATLATVGIVGAVTTIGENISTAGTLTVDSPTLYVGTTDRVGIGTTTPFATLSVNNTTGENAFVIGSSTATWLKVDERGLLTVAKAATFSDTLAVTGASALTGNLAVDTNILLVDVTNDKVGVGTTTPFATLSVNNVGGQNAFVIGSSTATWLKVDASGLLTVAKAATFSSTLDVTGTFASGAATITGALSASTYIGVASTSPWGSLSVEQGTETYSFLVGNNGSSTPSLVVLGVNGNGRVGIASSTPSAGLSVGASTAATTTIDFAKPCFRMTTDSGTILYYWPSLAGGVLGGWATSTVSCF